jgi:hypothetical protein
MSPVPRIHSGECPICTTAVPAIAFCLFLSFPTEPVPKKVHLERFSWVSDRENHLVAPVVLNNPGRCRSVRDLEHPTYITALALLVERNSQEKTFGEISDGVSP